MRDKNLKWSMFHHHRHYCHPHCHHHHHHVSISGLSWSGKSQGKRTFYKVRKKSGEIFGIFKVSEKSGNSVFRFIVHKFSSRFWNAISFRKDEKYAAKQPKGSLWHSMPDTCSSCGQWFSMWMLSSKFLLPLSAKSRKRLKIKRKLSKACKKN